MRHLLHGGTRITMSKYKVVRVVRTEHGPAINNEHMPSLAAARASVTAHGGVLWSYCLAHGWTPDETCPACREDGHG